MLQLLEALFPGKVRTPESLSDIPASGYMAYMLTFNGEPIVTGHGRKNRASVIFDDVGRSTNGHLKALFVRLYHLYGEGGRFERFLIPCPEKKEARAVEAVLQQQVGGNHRKVPAPIREKLFAGLPEKSVERLVLEIALRSSFDGLADLKKWRSDGLLDDAVWKVVRERLGV
jgi:hypothetical protein